MILEKLKYPFIFFGDESEEFAQLTEDIFYLSKGRKHKQFYKGQFIPIEIFNELYSKPPELIEENNNETLTEDIPEVEVVIETPEIKPEVKIEKSVKKKPGRRKVKK